MKRLSLSTLSAAALFPLLSACLQDNPAPAPTQTSRTPPQQDSRTVAPALIRGDSVFDSETGTGYLLNPNWKRVPMGQPASLQKGLGQIVETTDWSGTVTTRVYECSSSGYSVTVACGVDADFVVVGGGAYADYGSGSGALLTESRPLDNVLQTWVASSKDFLVSNYHTLHCYAIGLRVTGLSRATLLSNMYLAQITSGVTAHPEAGAGFPNEDYVVVGGGARANYQPYGTQGNFLTASNPYFADIGWYAKSKDHIRSNPASITSYAIGITSAWFYGSSPWLERQVTTGTGPTVSKGVSVAVAEVPYTWVLTGAGGTADYYYTLPGRLLYGIRPIGPSSWNNVTVYSKDHSVTCAGSSTAYAVSIRKKP